MMNAIINSSNTSRKQSKIFCVKCRRDGELPGGRRETAVEDLHPAVALESLLYAAKGLLLRGGGFLMEKTRISKKRRALSGLIELSVCAMLIALYVVLNRFVSFKAQGMSIGFSIVAPMIAGMVFGPISGGVVYALGDLLGSLLFPFGPYHPGYTISAFCMGVLLGFFLHPQPLNINAFENKQITADLHFSWKKIRIFPNILVPLFINAILFGIFLNSAWTAQLYSSKTYWGWVLARTLTQYPLQLPVNILLATALLPLSKMLRKALGKL